MKQFNTFNTTQSLFKAAVHVVVALSRHYIQRNGCFNCAIPGNGSIDLFYRLLSSDVYRDKIEWEKIDLFLTDEHFIPLESTESSYNTIKTLLIEPLNIPLKKFHHIQTQVDPIIAAQKYQEEIRRYLGIEGVFDLVIIAIGASGNIASLFSNTESLHEEKQWVTTSCSESGQTPRITIAIPLLNKARHIIVLASGQNSADVYARMLSMDETYPLNKIKQIKGDLLLFTDQDVGSLP